MTFFNSFHSWKWATYHVIHPIVYLHLIQSSELQISLFSVLFVLFLIWFIHYIQHLPQVFFCFTFFSISWLSPGCLADNKLWGQWIGEFAGSIWWRVFFKTPKILYPLPYIVNLFTFIGNGIIFAWSCTLLSIWLLLQGFHVKYVSSRALLMPCEVRRLTGLLC